MALVLPSPGQTAVRNRIAQLQTNFQHNLEIQVENTQDELRDLEAVELDKYVIELFSIYEQSMVRSVHDVRDCILRESPRRNQYSTIEEYEEAQRKYRTLVSWSGVIIIRLEQWFSEFFQDMSDFFRRLWTWIKDKVQNVAKCVKEFVNTMRRKITELYRLLFDE